MNRWITKYRPSGWEYIFGERHWRVIIVGHSNGLWDIRPSGREWLDCWYPHAQAKRIAEALTYHWCYNA